MKVYYRRCAVRVRREWYLNDFIYPREFNTRNRFGYVNSWGVSQLFFWNPVFSISTLFQVFQAYYEQNTLNNSTPSNM